MLITGVILGIIIFILIVTTVFNYSSVSFDQIPTLMSRIFEREISFKLSEVCATELDKEVYLSYISDNIEQIIIYNMAYCSKAVEHYGPKIRKHQLSDFLDAWIDDVFVLLKFGMDNSLSFNDSMIKFALDKQAS